MGRSTNRLTPPETRRVGPVAGGLINATFGNATELMILVSAVSHGLVAIEQAVLLGGILMNMLLALGVSFIAGGARAMLSTRPPAR